MTLVSGEDRVEDRRISKPDAWEIKLVPIAGSLLGEIILRFVAYGPAPGHDILFELFQKGELKDKPVELNRGLYLISTESIQKLGAYLINLPAPQPLPKARQGREWRMNLNQDAMNRVEAGTKQIEARLDKPKWKHMKVGDTIVFQHGSQSPIKLRVEVLNLLRYPTFEELFDDWDPMQYNGKTKEEQLDALLRDRASADAETGYYWVKEVEDYGGVLGILIKFIGRV